MNITTEDRHRPWYREFWVWFVIALPLSAVIAGLGTLWIAVSHADVELTGPEHQTGFVMHAPPATKRP